MPIETILRLKEGSNFAVKRSYRKNGEVYQDYRKRGKIRWAKHWWFPSYETFR